MAPDVVFFPPRNETLDFRRQLDARLRDSASERVLTAVDAEGETVWTQEYLELRVRGCSHEDATAGVLNQIGGRPALACVAP